MNGFIARTLAALAVGSSLTVTLGGCVATDSSSLCGTGGSCGSCGGGGGVVQNAYSHLVDPCYPERYWAIARANTEAMFRAQISNGHILQQTVWNYHFEPGTDRLNAGGRDHLMCLSRRRP